MIRLPANAGAVAEMLLAVVGRASSDFHRMARAVRETSESIGKATPDDAIERQYARIRIEERLLDGGMIEFADRVAWWNRTWPPLGEPPRDAFERGDWSLIEASLEGRLSA